MMLCCPMAGIGDSQLNIDLCARPTCTLAAVSSLQLVPSEPAVWMLIRVLKLMSLACLISLALLPSCLKHELSLTLFFMQLDQTHCLLIATSMSLCVHVVGGCNLQVNWLNNLPLRLTVTNCVHIAYALVWRIFCKPSDYDKKEASHISASSIHHRVSNNLRLWRYANRQRQPVWDTRRRWDISSTHAGRKLTQVFCNAPGQAIQHLMSTPGGHCLLWHDYAWYWQTVEMTSVKAYCILHRNGCKIKEVTHGSTAISAADW